MCGWSVSGRARRKCINLLLQSRSIVRGPEKPLCGVSSVRGAEMGPLYFRNSQLSFPVPSIIYPPCPVSLACPGMEAHYFETRLICLVDNSLPQGCIEDLVWQSICGILCFVSAFALLLRSQLTCQTPKQAFPGPSGCP